MWHSRVLRLITIKIVTELEWSWREREVTVRYRCKTLVGVARGSANHDPAKELYICYGSASCDESQPPLL